jgi:hypothetical protein
LPISIPEVALVVALFACLLAMIEMSVPFAASAMMFLLFLVIAVSRETELGGGAGWVGRGTAANLPICGG